jgi:predicted PurR-regulated permease PerM
MVHEVGRIWNAFLRGQLIIVMLVVFTYTLLMTILGVRFAVGIAIMAGLARFVPYLGPFVTWGITALVAIFQPPNYMHLEPLKFAIIVVVAALLVDQIFDNLVSPQVFGSTLSVHPAAVLLAALIAAQLIGVIGLLVAAPVLATFQLAGRYTVRKMLDMDPWEGLEEAYQRSGALHEKRVWNRFRAWWRATRAARRLR